MPKILAVLAIFFFSYSSFPLDVVMCKSCMFGNWLPLDTYHFIVVSIVMSIHNLDEYGYASTLAQSHVSAPVLFVSP